MPEKHSSERGQALVLVVLGILVIFGFAALAIDGGMVYSDRRHAQNASDASSLAGGSAAALSLENDHVTYGHWDCNDGDVEAAMASAESAAIARAGDNDFSIDDGIGDFNGVIVECGIENRGAWTEKYIDVTTHISTTTPTTFAHFVYPGQLKSRVRGVTRVHPRAALGFGHSIVALNEEPSCHAGAPNGVTFEGSIEVQVTGGGIFSNGCIQASGNDFDVEVEGGNIVHVGELETNHEENFDPPPDDGGEALLPDFAMAFPTPDCDAPGMEHSSDHPGTEYRNNVGGTYADPEIIRPGNYSQIKMNGAVELRPGLYCLYGDFAVGNNDLTGNGVTIYMVSGSVNIDGGGVVTIFAPEATPDPEPAIPGMLIYLAKQDNLCDENDGLVKLRGNADSVFDGTIYAPCGRVDIAGAADVPAAEFNTQIVAMDVEIGGNAYVNVNFDQDTNYLMPTSLELHR